jgi:hypothetical protein
VRNDVPDSESDVFSELNAPLGPQAIKSCQNAFDSSGEITVNYGRTGPYPSVTGKLKVSWAIGIGEAGSLLELRSGEHRAVVASSPRPDVDSVDRTTEPAQPPRVREFDAQHVAVSLLNGWGPSAHALPYGLEHALGRMEQVSCRRWYRTGRPLGAPGAIRESGAHRGLADEVPIPIGTSVRQTAVVRGA